MKRTRSDLLDETHVLRERVRELTRQRAQSSTEREEELREALKAVVSPPVARQTRREAEEAWKQAVANGRRLVGAEET